MNTIISKSNEKAKFIKSLNEKKFRQKYSAFYIEGIKVVEEILSSKKAIDILFIAYSKELLEKANGGESILNKISKLEYKVELIEFRKDVFEYIVDTKSPQGIIAVVKIPDNNINEIDFNNEETILILDKIQDLGNLGTIIRTAEAFEISNIICIEGTTDVYSPKAVRSTMGSIFRQNIVYCKIGELDNLLKLLKENNYIIYSTVLEESKYIEDVSFKSKCAFVLGNEANGVSEYFKKNSDKNIKIKMSNKTDSLNVSIASGIVLYKQYIEKNK